MNFSEATCEIYLHRSLTTKACVVISVTSDERFVVDVKERAPAYRSHFVAMDLLIALALLMREIAPVRRVLIGPILCI